MKFGFYWEATKNDQPSSNNANGQFIYANWGGNSTNNAYADVLTGRLAQYVETNKDVLLVMSYRSTDFYATDSWKLTRRLTLDYGLRFQHLGPWSDQNGTGLAIFDKSKYSDNPADVNKLTGVLWNKIDSSIPLSGAKAKALYFNPRFGFAWDIFGNAKTVVRGGFGVYHFHDEQNVQSGALNVTQGVFGYTTPTAVTVADIAKISAGFVAPGGISVLDRNDDRQPMTQSYSFTISQRAPWSSSVELSYVGNKSKYLSNWNNNIGQLNLLQYGTLFKVPGYAADGFDPSPYHTYHNYQTIKVLNHEMYSNYNSLQASWNKQSGKINYLANYTFSKALGIRGEGGNNGIGDPTTLSNAYGTLPNDRTHIFNFAYVVEMGNPVKGNRLAKGVVNGWQLSGITQFQSGVNLQNIGSANFNLSGNFAPGTRFADGTDASGVSISATRVNGTPDISAMPVLTCDPRTGLKGDQFINPSCFAPPTPGHNGSFIFPYIKGPAFVNSDLTLFKNFKFGEGEKKLQFRTSAYNFLNHPLTTFVNGDNNLNLGFTSTGQVSNPLFGTASTRTGHRTIQFALKFYF